MLPRAFIVDWNKKDWQETFANHLINDPIESLPELLPPQCGQYSTSRPSERGWINLRWRVACHNEVVFIAVDRGRFIAPYAREPHNQRKSYILKVVDYRVNTLSLSLTQTLAVPEKNCRNIPLCVAGATVDFLQEEAEKLYGYSFFLPASIQNGYFNDGRTLIDAALRYPHDINLWYVQDFFDKGRQHQEIFQPGGFDTFPLLCEQFSIEPTTALREAYNNHPYAIIMTRVLESLGIKEPKLIEPFLKLNKWNDKPIYEGLCDWGIYTYHCLFSHIFHQSWFMDDMGISHMLQQNNYFYRQSFPYIFICQLLRQEIGEIKLAQRLLAQQMTDGDIFNKFATVLFYNFHIIPIPWRRKIISSPLTEELYAELLAVIDAEKVQRCTFHYPPEIKACEGMVDGFEFRLISNSDEFTRKQRAITSCGNPKSPLLDGDGVVRLGIYKNGEIGGCLTLQGIFKIYCNNSGGIYEHTLLTASLRIAVLHWLKATGLYKNYGPYFSTDYAYLSEDVQLLPLSSEQEGSELQ